MKPQDTGPVLPPHSKDMEESVLGGLLIAPDLLHAVRVHLRPDDFYFIKHGWVYEAMLKLSDDGMGIDARTLAEAMRASGRLDAVGHEQYLNYLPTTVATALYTESYAVLVARYALRRRLIKAAGEIAAAASDMERDTGEALAAAQLAVLQVGAAAQSNTITFEQSVSRIYDDIDGERRGITSSVLIPTPWTGLNARLGGGLQGGQLIIPAARPGYGKSAMMLQIAAHAARLGKRVLFCSMEMSDREITARVVAQDTNIPADQLHNLSDPQWAQFVGWVGERAPAYYPITYEISGGQRPGHIAALARDMKLREGLDMVIVDYLQIMKPDRDSGQNPHTQLGSITSALKALALDLDVPVVLASQLNRDAANARPHLHQLRDSGSIESDANVVLLIWQDKTQGGLDPNADTIEDGAAVFIVAKNRNGAAANREGDVPLVWLGSRVMFGDRVRSQQQARQPEAWRGAAR